ncbi:MAG TPA: tyrosine-type recombinase/integrase [Fimbriimonadaceae bacterium]|nr:tyrosine-type recombinase/integrase [Fimbriimonadaceae bacterium]
MAITLKLEIQNTVTRAQKYFLDALRSSDKSSHTISHYNTTFKRFNSWLYSQGTTDIEEITKHQGRAFMSSLKEEGLSPRTRYGIIVDLKTWLTWLVKDGELAKSPFDNVELPDLPRPVPETYEKDEFAKLMKQCAGSEFTCVRNRAILYLLLDTGIRREELVNLKVDDVNLTLDQVHIRHGKGDKARFLVLSAKASMTLAKYLNAREKTLTKMNKKAHLESGDFLWIGERGPVTYHGLGTILRKLGAKSGVQVRAHKFRKTYATIALNSGQASLEDVRRQLGHSDYQVLKKHYLDTAKANIETARRMSPLSNGWS